MPRLLVEKGPDRGKSVTVAVGGQIVAGRDKAADLQLSDSMASRRHFLIASKGSIFGLKDLNSANGTLVNGRVTQGALRLAYGDSIQIGETLISWMPDEQTDKHGGLIGQQIGGYRVEERLGRGAMGTVYKATQLSLGRTVALKVLSPDLVKDQKFCEMFVKEARAAGSLNHPNIIQVYDVGDEGDQYFFSMEYASKGSVLEELAEIKAIPMPRAVQIIKHACNALDYAERKGLVHRDIKPDNLMVTEDNTVKLGDLGLAMSTQELQAEQDGVFGTPHYIAPEQAMGKAIDHRADIYALGATFYRMLTGKTLYTGATVKEILKKQVREAHPPITNHMHDCPQAIVRIIDRMLAKAPAERYQHASDIVTDLTNWETLAARKATSDGTAFAERPAGLTADASQQFQALNRQRKLIIAGVVALVAVLVAAASIWFFVFADTPNPINNTIAPSNTPANSIGNTPPTELAPEVKQANDKIRADLSVVDFLLQDPNPRAEDLRTAIARLENALLENPKGSPEVRDEAQARLDGLIAQHEEMNRGALDVAEEWQTVRREASAQIKEFRYVDAAKTIKAFLDKHASAGSDGVRTIVKQATVYSESTLQTEISQHYNAFEAGINLEIETAKGDSATMRATTARDALARIRDAEAACDESGYKVRLKEFGDKVERQLRGFEREAEAADRQSVLEALGRAKNSLAAVFKLCSDDVAKGDFANVSKRLEAWQKSDPDYSAHRTKPGFSELADDIKARNDRTEIMRLSLARLSSDLPGVGDSMKLLRSKPWPENVSRFLGGDDMLVTFSTKSAIDARQWTMKIFDPDGPESTREASAIASIQDRTALAAAILHLIENHPGSWDRLMLPVRRDGPPALAGLFMWMSDLEVHESAFTLIRYAWNNIHGSDASRPYVRELYARGLLNRALSLAARGDQTTANNLLRELETNFSDTRANRDRK